MSELTPIISYSGPETQKKEWTKRGIELLKEIETTQPGLAVRTQMKHFPDGSTVFAQTVENGIDRVDKLDIKVPTVGGEDFKVEVLGRVFCPFYIGISDVNDFAWPHYNWYSRSRVHGDVSPGIHKNFEYGPDGTWNIDSVDGIKVYGKCSGNVDSIMQAVLDSEKSGMHFVTSLSLDYAETSYDIKDDEWIEYYDTTTGINTVSDGYDSKCMDTGLQSLWGLHRHDTKNVIDTSVGPYEYFNVYYTVSSPAGFNAWCAATLAAGITSVTAWTTNEANFILRMGNAMNANGLDYETIVTVGAHSLYMSWLSANTYSGLSLTLIDMVISDDNNDCMVLYSVYNADSYIKTFYLYISGYGTLTLGTSEGETYVDIGYMSCLKAYQKPHVFLFSYSTYTGFPDYSEEYKMTYGIVTFEGGTRMITKDYVCDDWYTHNIDGCVDQNNNPYIFFGEIDLMQTPTKYGSKRGEL